MTFTRLASDDRYAFIHFLKLKLLQVSLFATMKFLLLLLICLTPFIGESQTLPEVRKSFHEAVLDPKKSEAFHDFLKDTPLTSPTLKAYKAASEAMLARVVWNPFSKLSQVMKYSDLMKVAIEEDERNVEIRFLRLAIEYNLPKFLGMSKHMDEDVKTIVSNMTSVPSMNLDASFCRYIVYFLRDAELSTEEEIQEMERVLTSGGAE